MFSCQMSPMRENQPTKQGKIELLAQPMDCGKAEFCTLPVDFLIDVEILTTNNCKRPAELLAMTMAKGETIIFLFSKQCNAMQCGSLCSVKL